MRRVQLYRKSSFAQRSAAVKFQKVVVKHLIQINKTKREAK